MFIDNWYNGVELCRYMNSRNTVITGTARSNRVPHVLKDKNMETGETACVVQEGVFAQKFVDKRPVYMLTTGNWQFHFWGNTRFVTGREEYFH